MANPLTMKNRFLTENSMPFSMPPDVVAGEWNGDPLVFRYDEAWLLCGGAWKEIHPDLIARDGRVLSG